MRTILTFKGKKISLKNIKTFIYNALELSSSDYAKQIYNQKNIKPFIYSFPYKDKNIETNNSNTIRKVKISISDSDFAWHFFTGIRKYKEINNNDELSLISIMNKTTPSFKENKYTFYTISPIVIKKKNNNYLNDPTTNEAIECLKNNIYKKLKINTPVDIEIKWLKYTLSEKKYKSQNIPCVWGELEIKAPENILRHIYNKGLGAKNALGFGMIEVKSISKIKKEK